MHVSSTTRVIIDTDPGVDDALAILLALSSPELDVVGITTVCGNVPVGQATKNLFRVLNLVQPPSELLVGQGAARPLEHQLVEATHFLSASPAPTAAEITNEGNDSLAAGANRY